MNRRTILRSLAALPLAAHAQPPAKPFAETPSTPTVNADSLAVPVVHTFNAAQFATLKRLGEILEPSDPNEPGANEAKAAEFLDFLIGQSPTATQDLYRAGLDALNLRARQSHNKSFSALTDSEAEPLLAPLRQPLTRTLSAATIPNFLHLAKDHFRRATVTSREYIAVVSQRRRGAGGSGQYWLPID